MIRSAKWSIGILVGSALLFVITVAFVAAKRPDRDKDSAGAPRSTSPVSQQNKETTITLDLQTQAREGIRVAPVKRTSMRTELHGTAVLLPVTDLANLRNAYFAARTKLQRDQVGLAVSRTQYQRVKTLYNQNQNMSLAAMQEAEAALRNNQGQVAADKQDAELPLDTIRQRWGTTVAHWVEANAPQLESIFDQAEFLAQVVYPPGEIAEAPAVLSIRSPGQHLTKARLVSSFPQVNPQIQGISFLYLLPARPGMAVGMNLAALVPVGQTQSGTIVPEDAVVWWQGAAWVYEQTSPTEFVRHAVPANDPVSEGYFVPGNTFSLGTKLVTIGASELLSKELLAHPLGEGGGAEDSDSD